MSEPIVDFDEVIERRGTHCAKWDLMEQIYQVPLDNGIAMWVADMDFRPPDVARDAIERMLGHGIFGYYGDERAYRASIQWWMTRRHNWQIEPEWVFSTHGLVNGTALCIDTFSSPGDGIVLFTPVYHAFARVIAAADRRVVECPLTENGGIYELAIESYDPLIDANTTMAILCSPHNPGGRVWTPDELRSVARFCRRHDLILVSDEIHHDLVMPGYSHVPMPLAAPETVDRLVMMTAVTKSFNLAGAHTGNVIIEDDSLRRRFGKRIEALGVSPNSFGLYLAEAVYSPEGAVWVDQLMQYVDGNRRIFDTISELPGLRSMPLEATYLAWVSFKATGLTDAQISRRVLREARIAANLGYTFGSGGEGYVRFNLATPRSRVVEAVERLKRAFS